MKFSYSWLKEYVPKLPQPKKLADLLMMQAFEVEGVEKVNKPSSRASSLLGVDYVLDVKVLPNRAFDCLSHLGMAREVAAITNTRYQELKIKIQEDKSLKIKDFLQIKVQDKKLCPRYSARMVLDLKVGESPKWLQKRLNACGMRPINNIVDITNYVMLEIGQPLHAFDFDKCDSNDANSYANDSNRRIIIVRKAKKGEKITTLDGDEYELDESILVIADLKGPLAIAGIKGGKKAEIDKKTKNIVLEAAIFNATNIRKSSQKLGLKTDSSTRFENGFDSDLTIKALNRAAQLIKQLANGKITSGIININTIKIKPQSVAVAHSYLESLLCIKISSQQVLNIFKRLQLFVKSIKKGREIYYEVLVPSWRNDLLTSEDLIEEVGRLYGYDKIPSVMPSMILVPALKNDELIFEDKIKDILVGAGYTEVYNYSLISEIDKTNFGFDEKILIGPKNPFSQEQKYLRPTLLVGLLKNVRDNLRYFEEIQLFEVGKTFKLAGKAVIERKKMTGILTRKTITDSAQLFYELKGVVDLLMEKLGVTDVWYDDHIENRGSDVDQIQIFHPLRRAQIKIGDKLIGWITKVNKKILERMQINVPTAVFEIDFEHLIELIEEEVTYLPPSRYPAISRDLTALVQPQVKVDEVLDIIENTGGRLVENVELTDVYEGEHLNADQKSLTFRIIYQSDQRTLTDAEVNKNMDKIIKALEEKGWEIRK